MTEPAKRRWWRPWRTDADATSSAEPRDAPAEVAQEGWLRRLRAGLNRSSNRLKDNIAAILTKRRLDAEALEALEEALITADLGVEAAAELILSEAGGHMATIESDDFWSGDLWNHSVIAALDAGLFVEWKTWIRARLGGQQPSSGK